MEDLEYLPSVEAANWINGVNIKEEKMDGKVLTQNIALLTECVNGSCDFKGELSIDELRSYPDPPCPECNAAMKFEECVIRN